MKKLLLFVLIIGIFFLFACRTVYREIYPNLHDGRYDSEFPYRDCSEQLEEFANSVKMITCVAYYKSYYFLPEQKVTLERLQTTKPQFLATKEIYLTRTSSGTATIILSSTTGVLLVTCAHVVLFQDTIVTFYYDDKQQPTVFVRSVAFKERQSNYTAGITGSKELNIIAMDQQRDVAFIGTRFNTENPPLQIRYPLGFAKELEWNFVYVVGYPGGQCILTKGIVSNPRKDKLGSFFIDAVVNRGYSGGPVLAIRDGVPNFEIVGMVRLVVAKAEYYLSPTQEGTIIDYDPETPYTGDMYINKRYSLDYGVTQVIPSESIYEVLNTNKQKIINYGFDIAPLIHRFQSVKTLFGSDSSVSNKQ